MFLCFANRPVKVFVLSGKLSFHFTRKTGLPFQKLFVCFHLNCNYNAVLPNHPSNMLL